jgi:hypothetical protein
MYYLIHPSLPTIIAVAMLFIGGHFEWSISSFDRAVNDLVCTYIAVSFPH